ncbi:MAG: hypothetical protein ACKOOI_01340 [Pirellula sp.]
MAIELHQLALRLTRVCCCLCLLLPTLSWAQDSGNERYARWIESAPPGIKRLIEIGEVSFETDDRQLAAHKKQGLAKFTFDYQYRYRLIATSHGVHEDTQEPVLNVSAKIQLTNLKLAHRVFILSTFDQKDPWKSRLLQHEFDHVSISTDPRLNTLLKICLGAPLKIQIPLETEESETRPLSTRIDEQIHRTMQQRVKEIERITQALNDQFDKESSDGVRNISERERFFSEFFTVETLKRLEFKSPSIFEEYNKAISKSPWQVHYSLNTPP